MIRYFISYSQQDAGMFGTGNCEIRLQRPIRSMDDLTAITAMLRRNGISNPLLLSFSRFDTDVEDSTPPQRGARQ